MYAIITWNHFVWTVVIVASSRHSHRLLLSLADRVELKDRRRRKKRRYDEEEEEERGDGCFSRHERLSISKLVSLEGACTRFVYMLKRRYLPRRSKRLHKQARRLHGHWSHWRFSGLVRRTDTALTSCKIVSWSNWNACRCTRESISLHSTGLVRFHRFITRHRCTHQRGDEIKLQPVIEPAINLLLSRDARTVDVCLRGREREELVIFE